jgi:hypothetical protein
MADNRTVTVTVGRTINMGNYESLRLDETVTADVLSHESVGEALTRVAISLEVRVDRDAETLAKNIKARK